MKMLELAAELKWFRERIASLEAERDQLRAALEFYAWADHYAPSQDRPYQWPAVMTDHGKTARAALREGGTNGAA